MKHLYDWNCHLYSGMNALVEAPEDNAKAMRLLYERFGMDHFLMLPCFDASYASVQHFLLRRDHAEEALRAVLPDFLKVKFAARVLLRPDLHKVQNLEKLYLTRDGYLALQLPMHSFEDWVDLELNRLLYLKKCKLLFTSFEFYPLIYPKDFIEKLLRIKNLAVQFNYKAIYRQPEYAELIQTLLRNNQSVLFGTTRTSLREVQKYKLDLYQKSAAERLSVADYETVLRKGDSFWKKLK